MRKTLDPARIAGYFDTSAGPSGCHPWKKAKTKGGYGLVSIRGQLVYAHRAIYELLVGPIPEGYDIDHTCHIPSECSLGEWGSKCPHRACGNILHLKPVPHSENCASERLRDHYRKAETCQRGHRWTDENTRWTVAGTRRCRECLRISARTRYRRSQERALE